MSVKININTDEEVLMQPEEGVKIQIVEKDRIDFDLNLRVIQDNLPRKYHKKIIMGISTYNQSARSAGKKVLYARKLNFPNICVFSYSTFKEKPVYWTLLKRYFNW